MNTPPALRNARPLLLPLLAGFGLLSLFVALGFWQLDRAAQKREIRDAFEIDGDYVELDDDASYEMYQRVTASGRYLAERQILLENIVVDGRLGYYVITPFEYAAGKPLLLVNRGWIARAADEREPPSVAVSDRPTEITGRIGRLPRVGIRPGPAFVDAAGWPRRALWPEPGEIAAALDREVLPYVLLADPDRRSNLLRRWEPQDLGPMRHVGYAVQWFALALAVAVTAVVLYRRGRRPE